MSSQSLLRDSKVPETKKPSHEMSLELSQKLRNQIEAYASEEGIGFDEAVSNLSNRGLSSIRIALRKKLRNR